MRVLGLKIRGFRGIRSADLVLDEHLALIGTNGVGKSTIIDALSLVFGRSKLVPTLTEHDFTGELTRSGSAVHHRGNARRLRAR